MPKTDKQLLCFSLVFGVAILGLTVLGDILFVQVQLLPDQGAAWYFWKLPTTNWLIRLSYWVPYILHQVVVWFLIYKLSALPHSKVGTLSKYNKAILYVNLFFVALHLVQTWVFYDGLAQDTPVWSSQYSVIVVLVLLLILQNPRRGLFFGKKAKLPKRGTSRIVKYHGYYVAWAIVFTFWFHPMVSTPGHLVGFMYIFLFLTQLSLPKTPLHSNKYWLFVLEVTVLVHGTVVALTQKTLLWTMFLSGFAALLVITQIYGLALPKKAIAAGSVVYLLVTLGLYTFYPTGRFSLARLAQIHQLAWIPIVEYSLVFLIAFLAWLVPASKKEKQDA